MIHVLYAVALVAAMCTRWPAEARPAERFYVQGKVYCDPCRAQFVTRVSEYMAGARVRLVCKRRDEEEMVTLTAEATTDKDGVYRIPVTGDHADEICEVHLVKSSKDECKEVMENGMEKSRVVLTSSLGLDSPVRFANSLGFMKPHPDVECADVLADMGFIPDAGTL